MLGQYLPLLVLLILAALFAAGSLIVSGLLAPRRPTVAKLAPYECGIVPATDTPERFPVRFFLVAMIFIVFDIEIILFYPYALARGGLGVFGLGVLIVFTFAVFESFVYLIAAGALDWGPAPGAAASPPDVAPEAVVSSGPTGKSTIRRVGLEGRRATTAAPATTAAAEAAATEAAATETAGTVAAEADG